jgi:hypothetical protein
MPAFWITTPPTFIRILLTITAFIASTGALTCTSALLQSGYPTCINGCASICENYCPDVTDTTCECTTPAYTKKIFDCVRRACSASDYSLTENMAIAGCSLIGINVAPQISAMDASVAATATGTKATNLATGTAGSGTIVTITATPSKKTPALSISAITGIVIGAITGLSFIASAIWLVWAIQKRKAHANPNQNRGPVVMVAPQYEPPMDPAPKPEPTVQWIPQPNSDMYPTAVTQTLSDAYPTVVNNGQQQYQQQMMPMQPQQMPMQYQQIPFQQQNVSPIQQQPPFNAYPPTELPNSNTIAELPHAVSQTHVELPAGYGKS